MTYTSCYGVLLSATSARSNSVAFCGGDNTGNSLKGDLGTNSADSPTLGSRLGKNRGPGVLQGGYALDGDGVGARENFQALRTERSLTRRTDSHGSSNSRNVCDSWLLSVQHKVSVTHNR